MDQDLLDFIVSFKTPKVEVYKKTIFDIGLRGHYENPMSDILSFYLDPTEVHDIGATVLESLLSACNVSDVVPALLRPPMREHLIDDQAGRIDLILEGTDWILAIENKIEHEALNPFAKYKSTIERKFPEKSKKFFVILSPRQPTQAFDGWQWLDTRKFLDILSKAVSSEEKVSSNSKWLVFLSEFILNLQQLLRRNEMDANTFQQISENLSQIKIVADLYGSFYSYIQATLTNETEQILGQKLIPKNENWGDLGRAIRFYPYPPKSHNVTFLAFPDPKPPAKRFRVQYYVESNTDESQERRTRMCQDGFSSMGTERNRTLNLFRSDADTFSAAQAMFLSALSKIKTEQDTLREP
jgi:hypothetical protein